MRWVARKDAGRWHKSGVAWRTTGKTENIHPQWLACSGNVRAETAPQGLKPVLYGGALAAWLQTDKNPMASYALSAFQALDNGSAIARYLPSHARCGASSRGCRPGCFRSGRINRSSSELYFAVANGCCFYTLRATGPYPVETQAFCWDTSRMLCLSLFLGLRAFGEAHRHAIEFTGSADDAAL